MFVPIKMRKKGIAVTILNHLEKWQKRRIIVNASWKLEIKYLKPPSYTKKVTIK